MFQGRMPITAFCVEYEWVWEQCGDGALWDLDLVYARNSGIWGRLKMLLLIMQSG